MRRGALGSVRKLRNRRSSPRDCLCANARQPRFLSRRNDRRSNPPLSSPEWSSESWDRSRSTRTAVSSSWAQRSSARCSRSCSCNANELVTLDRLGRRAVERRPALERRAPSQRLRFAAPQDARRGRARDALDAATRVRGQGRFRRARSQSLRALVERRTSRSRGR
jgi:hypothetical protein